MSEAFGCENSLIDSPVDVFRQWSPSTTGLSLATKEQIQPFLEQGQGLTSKCNTVILAETMKVEAPFSSDTHVINMRDHWGGEALIRIHLIHLGDQKAKRTPLKEITVSAGSSVRLMVALLSEHLTSSQWQGLSQAPVKFLMKVLGPDGNLGSTCGI